MNTARNKARNNLTIFINNRYIKPVNESKTTVFCLITIVLSIMANIVTGFGG